MRAFAVCAVVLFHLWPNRLPGGYIGVDVFFVISGFLITSHLLRSQEKGRLSLTDFWAKRARRLLPAAYLVLAVTAIATLLWVPKVQWQTFFLEIGAAAIYVENWELARNSVDYLAAQHAASPVQHYWTLSGEEQFYLIWPLLVLLAAWIAARSGANARRTTAVVLGVVTAASLVFSLWWTVVSPETAYFITPARAWEFGLGAMLAFVPVVAGRDGLRSLLSWVSLAVLTASCFVLGPETPMPGTAAVVVCVATAALIWAGNPTVAWSPTRIGDLKPFQWLGEISYSLYLWHWPLIILTPYALGVDHLGFVERVLIGAASVLLAVATKHWVEDPVRTHRKLVHHPGRSLAATGVAAVLLVGASGTGWGYVEKQNREDAELAAAITEDAPRCFGAASRAPGAKDCPNPELDDVLIPTAAGVREDWPDYPGCDEQLLQRPLEGCLIGERKPGRPHVAVIGDSHARVLATSLERLADRGYLSVELFHSSGCSWTAGEPFVATTEFKDRCRVLKRDLNTKLSQDAGAYDFVMTTAWSKLIAGPKKKRVELVKQAWEPVLKQGVPVVAVRDNPTSGETRKDQPACVEEAGVARANAECSLNRKKSYDSIFDPFGPAVKQSEGAHLIDLTDFYCDEDTCPAVIGGVNVYRDRDHISVTYAETLAPYIWRELRAFGLVENR
nr:acyltransferase family protein [Nocardioides albus]